MPLIIEYATHDPLKLTELLGQITQKVIRRAKKDKRKREGRKNKVTPLSTLKTLRKKACEQ